MKLIECDAAQMAFRRSNCVWPARQLLIETISKALTPMNLKNEDAAFNDASAPLRRCRFKKEKALYASQPNNEIP
jgi:hypothetical protein